MNTNGELYGKVTRLQWLLQKNYFKGQHGAGPMADTARGQGRILALLKIKDGISTKDISYILGIRVSSLNELLAKLEKNGFITREPSDSDKRVVLNKLTQKGRDAEEPQANICRIFECLTEEEQGRFSEYLDRVIAALENEIGEEPGDRYEEVCQEREKAFKRFFEGGEGFERFREMRGEFDDFGSFCARFHNTRREEK